MLPWSNAEITIPTLNVDLEDIRELLTRDSISRKLRQWRLLTESEMDEMLLKTQTWLIGSYNNFKHDAQCYIVARKHYLHPYIIIEDEFSDAAWSNVEALAMQLLEFRFPIITQLLLNFNGRLIAAGGAVVKSLFTDVPEGIFTTGEDIDLFFIDPEVESDRLSEAEKRERYDEWLASAIAFLVNAWFNQNPKHAASFVLRGEFVTTVYLSNLAQNLDIKYQFIHRVYPNTESVLGGFDLGPAMIAFTGEKIVATELGAWSALARTAIVDVSRRSTSFEHRLQKYGQFCHIVLPGLLGDSLPPKLADLESTQTVKGILDALVAEQYPKIKDYEGCVQKCSSQEFKILLVETAYEHGYILDQETYLDDLKPSGHRDKIYLKHYLKPAIGILRLPAMEIRCPETKREWGELGRTWNLRVPKDPEIEYEINCKVHHDYDPEPVLVTSSRTYSIEQELSDYDTNPAWPSLRFAANLKMLTHGKLHGVVSITVFHHSSANLIDYFDGNLQCGLSVVKDSLHQINAATSDFDIMQLVLRQSLQRPTIGDWINHVHSDENGKTIDKEALIRNVGLVNEKLTGIRWIVTNPGRQWTSSINPLVGDPREWYGPLYRSFRIGNQATETTLRLIRLRSGNVFSKQSMPRDVFNLLLRYTIWTDSQA